MRHRKLVVWVMIIGVAAGALPSAAATTAATWGGVKRLYAGEAEFVLGPGVSALEAGQAMRCATGEGGASFEGPVQVVTAGRSSQGKVFAVMGRGAPGTVDAHLVTESGTYLGGATVDPAAGTIRDFVTGVVLVRDDGLRTLDPAGLVGTVRTVLTRLTRALCNTVITPVVNHILSKLMKSGEVDIRTLAYLGLCAVILSLCEGLSDLNFEEVPTPGQPAFGGIPLK